MREVVEQNPADGQGFQRVVRGRPVGALASALLSAWKRSGMKVLEAAGIAPGDSRQAQEMVHAVPGPSI